MSHFESKKTTQVSEMNILMKTWDCLLYIEGGKINKQVQNTVARAKLNISHSVCY